ncbi:MAG: VWA domain-containing protein, partial [Bryobacteraceae bacterium]
MRLFSNVPLLLFAGAVIAPCLYAQEADPDINFRADTRLVVLHASVADRKGNLLTGLKRDAFRVYEDDVEQAIKVFRREDVPVSLGLIIDNSGSMRGRRRPVESAALAMVKASNPRDEVFIVNFNDDAFRDVDFTNDLKKMEEGLTRIDSRGGTALRDALSASIDYLKEKGKHQKKVLLIITDGNDTASAPGNTLEKLVQKAHLSEDVLIYSIGLLNEEEKREAKKAKRALQALAKASGGAAVFPEEVEDVEQEAVNMAAEIRNQYIIAYNPSNQSLDGSFREVRVEAEGPNKPRVRT